MSAVLEEAAKLCSNVLHPINRNGDEAGCVFDKGVVTTAPGFKEAYDKFVEGGWSGLASDPQYGGQGLFSPVNFAFDEMISSANMSFGLPPLTQGVYYAMKAHATEELKNLYLPKLVARTWTGTII